VGDSGQGHDPRLDQHAQAVRDSVLPRRAEADRGRVLREPQRGGGTLQQPLPRRGDSASQLRGGRRHDEASRREALQAPGHVREPLRGDSLRGPTLSRRVRGGDEDRDVPCQVQTRRGIHLHLLRPGEPD